MTRPAGPARARLVEERARAEGRLEGLSGSFEAVVMASKDDNADDEHDPEGATIAFERSQIDALIRQARRHLAETEGALVRLDEGSYGVCERCGDQIGADRLDARPSARACLRCATAG